MTKWTKRLLWLGVLAVLAIGGYYGGHAWLEQFVRQRSVAIAEQACGPGSRITIADVHIRLRSGLVRWTDVNIAQMHAPDDTTWTAERGLLITGHVDSIVVRGLSLWGLITRKTLHIQSLTVARPRLEMLTGQHTDSTATNVKPGDDLLVHRIILDSLLLDSGTVHVRRVGVDRPELNTRVDLHTTGLHVDLAHGGTPFDLRFADGALRLRDITAALPPLYDLRVSEVRVAYPDSLLLIHHMTVDPRKTPKNYGEAVRYETDLFQLHMDSLLLRGWDIAAFFNDRLFRTRAMCIGSTDLNVFRDKALPDEPYKPKRMPAKLLRDLPIGLDID
ncbi:MAG TPA: hypothetical protein VHL57_00735, partial [Flavobacteriales bacterium]|nr:hypothetical protein [Flavobacteriales bacterium]